MHNYTTKCAETFIASGLDLLRDVDVRDVGELAWVIERSLRIGDLALEGSSGMYVSDISMKVTRGGHVKYASICVSNRLFKDVPVVEIGLDKTAYPVVASRLLPKDARPIVKAFLDWIACLLAKHAKRAASSWKSAVNEDKSTQKSPDDGCQGSSVSAR